MESTAKFTNEQLKEKYNKVFKNDSTKFFTCNLYEESTSIINMLDSWNGLEVLEIGCGEGNLASMISYSGAKSIDAIDYSDIAIDNAKKKIYIKKCKFYV